MLDAFKLSGQSKFRITVTDIGDLLLLGFNSSLAELPDAIQAMFNHTLSINSFLMSTAARELQGAKIGVNYLCINTKKEWQPFLEVLSITAGSSLGMFTYVFTVIALVSDPIYILAGFLLENNMSCFFGL
jgi:hypothetical protein